jgi:hypothetical protein
MADRAARASYSDIIDRLLATLSRTAGEHSSVRLTRNARGETQIEVMVRTGEHGIDSIDSARIEAQNQYDTLAMSYPIQSDRAAE